MSKSEVTVQPLLVSPNEAARMLGVSPRTIWGITHPRGTLPVVRVGTGRGRAMYPVDALRDWVRKNQAGDEAIAEGGEA